MEQILFSCIGTTDPVRGEHDGPMLHIMRNYRPSAVYLFLNPEMQKRAQSDQRITKTQQWILDKWDNYNPQWHELTCDVENVHNIDALDEPLHNAVNFVAKEHPNAEILINVTSGTPQMQMILSQIAMDTRYRTRGIQVNNFEKKSGTTERTNNKNYDIDLELECNEDEESDAENRCVEPQMYAIRRKFVQERITTLLDQRDFSTVEQLSDTMPVEIAKLAKHLAARNRLDNKEAKRIESNIKDLPFSLYPYKTGSRTEYSIVVEYYLLMRNLVNGGHFSEFILRMEPLTLTLQIALLRENLKSQNISIDSFIYEDNYGHQVFDPFKLEEVFTPLYNHYLSNINPNWKPEKKDISFAACKILLSYFSDLHKQATHLFNHYEKLKNLRNWQAHRLTACTEKDIVDNCGSSPSDILKELEATIIACYSACDPAIFSVYDKSIEYIKKNL